MKRVRDILVALFATIFIVTAIIYIEPLAFDNFDLIQAQEEINYEGIPEEIQGVWEYSGELGNQAVTLRGNQMIITDDYNGTIYYTIDTTRIEKQFEMNDIENTTDRMLYTLTTDLEDYTMRYGDELAMMTTETFYFVYDAQDDWLIPQDDINFKRNHNIETVHIITDNLTIEQPINNEQLNQVDSTLLLALYEEHQALPDHEMWLNIYRGIADAYPELGLLRNDDYERYHDISQLLITNHGMSYRRLNQAGPAFILETYANLLNEYEDTEVVLDTLMVEIELSIQDYFERKLSSENSQRNSFE